MDMNEEMMRRLMELGLGQGDVGPFESMMANMMAVQKEKPQEYSTKLPSAAYTKGRYIAEYIKTIKQQNDWSANSRYSIQSQPPFEHGIAPGLSSLRPTTLKEVAKRVNYIHSDSVVFLKTIHKAYKRIATTILVEDDNGDCLPLCLSNYIHDVDDIDEILPKGTKLPFLAPYMKNYQEDKQRPLMLRCDNPQCIIRYDTNAAWHAAKAGKPAPAETMNPVALKEQGNAAFKRGKLDLAFRYYTRALACDSITTEDKVTCLSNRSQVSLRRQQWEQAENDARSVLEIESGHDKARFRLAKACNRLGKADAALNIARELLRRDASESDLPSFQALLMESKALVREQHGQYDFEQMRKESITGKRDFFHADYISTKAAVGVEIDLPNGTTYRGCKAVQDIGENELICASKALVFVAKGGDKESALNINVCTKRMESATQAGVFNETIALLHTRPLIGSKVYNLSAGPEFIAIADDAETMIDLSRIRAILSSNSFGAYGESTSARVNWEKWKKRQALHRPLTKSEHDEIDNVVDAGTGLWVNESMFNHSCVPNCTWSQIGDHMFIRSSRPISSGDELCIQYVAHDETFDSRREKFAKWIGGMAGFECQCPWCYAMRLDSDLHKITKAVEVAHEKAAGLVTCQDMPMWQAADKVFPARKRQELLSCLRKYPLHLQRNAAMNLCVMHGTSLNHVGNKAGALALYEEAAEIGYAIRGNAGIDRAQDLWRITGAALRCKQKSKAAKSLKDIWEGGQFAAFPTKDEARQAFIDLTVKFALPWYVDQMTSNVKRNALKKLARYVSGGQSVNPATSSGAKPPATCMKRTNPKKKKGQRK